MLLFGKIVVSGWAEALGTNFNLSFCLPLLGSPWDYARSYAAVMPGKVWITWKTSENDMIQLAELSLYLLFEFIIIHPGQSMAQAISFFFELNF